MQTRNTVPRKQFSWKLVATVLAVSVMLAFMFPSPAIAASKFKTLHLFARAGGNLPYSSLIFDSAGNLYGTTSQGAAVSAGIVVATFSRSFGMETALGPTR